MLNEPVGYERSRDDWTPELGLRRARRQSWVVGVAAILLSAPLAKWVPYGVMSFALRTPIAYGLLWAVGALLQRAAGMGDSRINRRTTAVVGVILASHHALFAVVGIPPLGGMTSELWLFPATYVDHFVAERDNLLIGWGWLNPLLVILVTGVPLLLASWFYIALQARGADA